jgi:hypothetical protein
MLNHLPLVIQTHAPPRFGVPFGRLVQKAETLQTQTITTPPDLTTHGVTDNLYNPDGGFTPGDLGFPVGRDNGLLSYGGLLFFVDYGKDYAVEGYPNQYLPYQVFFKSLLANDPVGEDYGGCPGDCGTAKLTVQTPGPLPLLGVGAAFGFSRNLRKRIKGSKSPEVMSALG